MSVVPAPAKVHNRIDQLFEKCRAEKRAALVLYYTSGFPDSETTEQLLPVLAEAGCDLLELGVPFSDPIADGPIIQHSSAVALEAGMTYPKTLEHVKRLREASQIPVVLFGALNPYLARGLEQSARMAADAGADGILAADLPLEESAEFRAILAQQGLHLITLVAPTTPDTRVDLIASQSSGFLYCIAMKGTTGALGGLTDKAAEYLNRLRARTTLPLALGFGISTPEHVRTAVAAGADGVVVGSALIRLIDETRSKGGNVVEEARRYVASLAAELGRA